MKTLRHILSLLALWFSVSASAKPVDISFEFLGYPLHLKADTELFNKEPVALSEESFHQWFSRQLTPEQDELVGNLLELKEKFKLDDWLYYQLIRRAAGSISPKARDYTLYTLCKWFLLTRSGYDASIKTDGSRILFYVRTDDNIYNIPYYTKEGRQYVCLNYHDYGNQIDFAASIFRESGLPVPNSCKPFSYRITYLPAFNGNGWEEREIRFPYYQTDYHFRIRVNPEIKTMFANYPVMDYGASFNTPLSQETYRSLIPLLKENTRTMSIKAGVDYLMRFTRYAFMFKPDGENFGMEKRLTPEQTLLYAESDCEDRAALFFYLVKEIYNLPMIVLAYPKHVTIAVKFDKPVGRPVIYNGEKYSVCEPTPQQEDLAMGQLIPSLSKTRYEVVYAYQPSRQ